MNHTEEHSETWLCVRAMLAWNKTFYASLVIAEVEDIGKNLTDSDWVLANVRHKGFYRVNYDEANWNVLIDQLNTDHLVRGKNSFERGGRGGKSAWCLQHFPWY